MVSEVVIFSSNSNSVQLIITTCTEPQRPQITSTNLNVSEVTLEYAHPLEMSCQFTGMPPPIICWYKDDVRIKPDHRIIFTDSSQRLTIRVTDSNDTGIYRCEGSNRIGKDTRKVRLYVTSRYGFFVWSSIMIGVLLVVMMLIMLYICIPIWRERKVTRIHRLSSLSYSNFYEFFFCFFFCSPCTATRTMDK